MITLYHFCTPQQWEQKRSETHYAPESLETEGFIHLSTKQQLPDTFERYFSKQEDVLLLRIELPENAAALRFEDSYQRGEAFPHYYAPLLLSSVQERLPVPGPTSGGMPDYNKVLRTFFEQL